MYLILVLNSADGIRRRGVPELRHQLRVVHEGVPVALVGCAHLVAARALGVVHGVLRVPAEQRGEVAHREGLGAGAAGQPQVVGGGLAPRVADRHVEHGPGEVAAHARRRPEGHAVLGGRQVRLRVRGRGAAVALVEVEVAPGGVDVPVAGAQHVQV